MPINIIKPDCITCYFLKEKKITYPSCCQIFKSSQFLAFTQSSRTSAGRALPGIASTHMRAAQPPAAPGLDPLSAAATVDEEEKGF